MQHDRFTAMFVNADEPGASAATLYTSGMPHEDARQLARILTNHSWLALADFARNDQPEPLPDPPAAASHAELIDGLADRAHEAVRELLAAMNTEDMTAATIDALGEFENWHRERCEARDRERQRQLDELLDELRAALAGTKRELHRLTLAYENAGGLADAALRGWEAPSLDELEAAIAGARIVDPEADR